MSYDISQDPLAQLLCDLCQGFYKLGWNLGTGGGASAQHANNGIILLTPSGVPKERLVPRDLFAWDPEAQKYVYRPPGKKPSASEPVFLWLHEKHGAGSVIHTHSLYSNLASRQEDFRISDQEYIKGIPNWTTGRMLSNTNELRTPVIENRATEDLLLGDLSTTVTAIAPATTCVLVRNHGAYHFGLDIWKCKAQAECLEYLFELDWKIKHG